MTDQISISVPRDDKEALVAGATMLLTLAGKVTPLELDDAGRCTSCNGAGACTAGADCVAADNPPPSVPEAPFAGSAATPVDPANTTTTAPASAGAAAGASPGDEAAAGPGGVELDANGLPWDARIHSGSKSKNKDETWRYKTGVDRKTLVPQVEAELRALMAIPRSTQEEPAADNIPNPPQETAPGVQTVSQGEATPPAGAVDAMNNSGAEIPTPPQEAAAPTTWPEFLKAVSAKIQQKTIDMPGVTTIVQQHGVESLQLLGNRVDLIPLVWAQIEQACSNG